MRKLDLPKASVPGVVKSTRRMAALTLLSIRAEKRRSSERTYARLSELTERQARAAYACDLKEDGMILDKISVAAWETRWLRK